MNKSLDMPLNDELFDRLVDGELSPVEYQDTLRAIESDPEGWRRCALAFLEAQAFGQELRAVPADVPAARHSQLPVRHRWSWWYGSLLAVACAASFLLALGVSLHIHGRMWTGPDPNDFARYAPPTLPVQETHSAPDVHLVGKPDDSQSVAEETLPMGRYRLVVDDGAGQPQEVDMPVFATGDPRARWLLDEEATAPREIIQALRNRGNGVERTRSWIPVEGSSGVPIYVPVDELHVTPASNRSFQ